VKPAIALWWLTCRVSWRYGPALRVAARGLPALLLAALPLVTEQNADAGAATAITSILLTVWMICTGVRRAAARRWTPWE
jgi:hypothetical protein